MNQAPQNPQDITKHDVGCTWAAAGLCVGLAILIFALASLVRSRKSESTTASKNESEVGNSDAESLKSKIEDQMTSAILEVNDVKIHPPSIGLTLEQLKRTSIPLSGYWKEEDLIVDDEASWIGSTCVDSQSADFIYLMTNRHCLGFEELYLADGENDPPEVLEYSLQLHFPGGKIKQVSQIGWIKNNVDLAWLAVSREGLEEGRDYIILKRDETVSPLEGMEVVVVGSPIDLSLEGTHTFGRVSALRSEVDSLGNSVNLIQTDASINHGNSGGPLFLKSGDRWVWAGVASSRVEHGGGVNLGMAIQIRDPAEYMLDWINSSPDGFWSLINLRSK